MEIKIGVAELEEGKIVADEEKTFSVIDLAMYGGATWDWHRLHYDKEFANEMKLPAPVIDGQMYGALFAKQAVDKFGPTTFVQRINFKMRSMAFAGDSLRIVAKIEHIEHLNDGRILSLGQAVLRDKVVVAEATTQIRIEV